MKNWPRLSELFALHPFADETAPAGTLLESHQFTRWQKIRFDNTVRLWIAIPTFVACIALWSQKVIPALSPILALFSCYTVIQFFLNWYFMGSRHNRVFDFVLTGVDSVSMSLSIYFTGAVDSPLYFLYFIPLIVHAFHRDSRVVMFCGISGVSMYALTIWSSLSEITSATVTNLIARLFFMLLTVGVACLAIAVLKRKDEQHRRQLARLEGQARLSEMLNQVVMLSDIEAVKNSLISLIDEGLGQKVQMELRFGAGIPISLDSMSVPLDIPAHSGVCVPVGGSENESFGELCVRCFESHAFQREELAFLRFIARSLGLTIQRVIRMNELRKSLEMNSCVMAATIASMRSIEATYKAVAEGIMTILQVEQIELFLWNPTRMMSCSVYKVGALVQESRQMVFVLKSLRGDVLGEIRVERTASSNEIQSNDLEIAATFAARAALALENALAHQRERGDIVHRAA